MLFECVKRHECPLGMGDCCFCCNNPDCDERCVEICEDVKDFSNRVHVPVKRLMNLEIPAEDLLEEYASVVKHFNQGHVEEYKKELREEILRRMKDVKEEV
ncbi:hypothetical protein BMS3Bbin16_00737 [archaeon BMS3Bbin16]|nr:hypothetical protein BMS3Bbin16_00737 [archaeon BMS3Bbin16]HDY74799.1 hypothetical protein [Euryarchaeota archaeon]